MIKDFTQFEAWKKSMQLASDIHQLTKVFPKEERYSLVDQMRRAALSVPANLAEGLGRFTYPDKLNKYVVSRGELIELMTFLHHSCNVDYIDRAILQKHLLLCEEVHKMLNGFISAMREKIP